jgi:outer membrane murein-binding lipoprotein Lpp
MADTTLNALDTLETKSGKGMVDPDFAVRVRMAMLEAPGMFGFAAKDDIRRIDVKMDTFATKDDVRRLDDKIDKVDSGLRAEINKVDAKIDAVSKDLNARIDKVDSKIDAVSKDLNGKIDAVSKDLNGKIDVLGNRMWHVGAAIITTVIVVAKFFAHS